VDALCVLLVPSPRALAVLVVQFAPPVTTNLPKELLVLLASVVLSLLQDPRKFLTALLVQKDTSLNMLEMLTAQSALLVFMKKEEPTASPVRLGLLLSSIPTEPRDAKPALKASSLNMLEVSAFNAPRTPTNPAEPLVTNALKVLTTMLKVVLNVSLALPVPTVNSLVSVRPAQLVTTLLFQDNLPAHDVPLGPTKRTELAALTVLPEVSLLLEPLNALFAPLVRLLLTQALLSVRSVPLTLMKRGELNVLIALLANGLMMVLPPARLLFLNK